MRAHSSYFALAAFLLAALAGCHPACGPARWDEGSPGLALVSGGPPWPDAERPFRLHGQALVKTPFAKVPMTAIAIVDISREKLDFVGMGEWGGKLAEVALDGQVGRASILPMLRRLPGLEARLPEALRRVFLAWPDDGRASMLKLEREQVTGRPLVKRGGEGDARWRVDYAYASGSDGSSAPARNERQTALSADAAAPSRIEYRQGGFSLILLLTEASANE
jgi:hypothetical protein